MTGQRSQTVPFPVGDQLEKAAVTMGFYFHSWVRELADFCAA